MGGWRFRGAGGGCCWVGGEGWLGSGVNGGALRRCRGLLGPPRSGGFAVRRSMGYLGPSASFQGAWHRIDQRHDRSLFPRPWNLCNSYARQIPEFAFVTTPMAEGNSNVAGTGFRSGYGPGGDAVLGSGVWCSLIFLLEANVGYNFEGTSCRTVTRFR